MGADDSIEVRFIHPHTSRKLVADLSPYCTGHDALQALLSAEGGKAPFLSPAEGQTYGLFLERASKAITPNMTFLEAGAINGDIVSIQPNVVGAGPGWSELGHMLFWSAAAASIFLKTAAPILVEFLRGRSSRSITVQRGDEKIVITGTDADKAMEVWKLLEGRHADRPGDELLEQSDRLTPPITVTLTDSKGIDSAGDD
jgi:hypothetical protein